MNFNVEIPDLNINLFDKFAHIQNRDLNLASNDSLVDLNVEPLDEILTQVPDLTPPNIFYGELNGDTTNEDDVQIERSQELSESNLITEENSDNDTTGISSTQVLPLKQSRNLEMNERRAVYDLLLQKSVNGKLKKGMIKEVALVFSISTRTVMRFWKMIKNNEEVVDIIAHKRNGKCGRKIIPIDYDELRMVPLHKRTNLRALGCALNVDKSTLSRRLKEGKIRRHSNAIKPCLKEENKRQRLQFCISMIDPSSIPHDPTFKGMYNIIHIDEKWFYMTKKAEKYYLLPDEDDPIRTCKSKNYITKVMFLTAVARPRFEEEGHDFFSGLIGIFPFVKREPAQRSSVNRIAGTLVTKPETVTRDVTKTYLIEKLLPAIREKWPKDDMKNPIYIQQDNARPHIKDNDEDFRRAATQDGFDIRLMSQPPNSPDLNVLDLGFFNAIQSLQHKEAPRNIDELIDAVEKSFWNYSPIKSNHIFLTLQSCMVEIMKAKGSHKYKIPHMKKEMLERRGQLPTKIKCDPMLVQETLNYLS